MNCLTTLLSYLFPRPSSLSPSSSRSPSPEPHFQYTPPYLDQEQKPIPLLPLPHPHPRHKQSKRVRFGSTAHIPPPRRLSTSSLDNSIILPHRRPSSTTRRRRSIMKPPTPLDQEMVFRNTCRMVAVAEQRLELSYHYIARGGGDLEAVLMEEEYMLFDEARGLAAMQGALLRGQTLRRVGGRRRRLRKKRVPSEV